MKARTFIAAGLAGAAAAYLLDPVSGRGRRSRLRDQAMAALRRLRRRAEQRGRYVTHLAEGKLAQLVRPSPEAFDVDDATIGDRIRSEVLGTGDVRRFRISVDVADGIATLRGEVDSDAQIRAIESRVGGVAGVAEVVNLLHLPGRAAPNKESAIASSRRQPAVPEPPA
jgi:hyperosmotically inducible periplasmic protein